MKKILQNLLDNYLIGAINNASVPYLVDDFFETYILTDYPDLKIKIQIYYLPLTERYKIVKIESSDDFFYSKEVFEALILKDKNSNSPESLIGRIYSDLIITQEREIEKEESTDTVNESELWFDSLSEDEKIQINEKYNLGIGTFDAPYLDLDTDTQEKISDAFKQEVK